MDALPSVPSSYLLWPLPAYAGRGWGGVMRLQLLTGHARLFNFGMNHSSCWVLTLPGVGAKPGWQDRHKLRVSGNRGRKCSQLSSTSVPS